MASSCYGTMHTVQPGQTLWLISITYGISVDKIIEANPNVDPYNLQVGQQICIPSECQGIIYTIKPGDSLWLIARDNNSSIDKIISSNPSLNPNNLQVGQQICIPTSGLTVPEALPPAVTSPPISTTGCRGIIYTIKPGDTFWLIAQNNSISVQALLDANSNVDSNNLQVGQKICIPITPTVSRESLTYLYGNNSDNYLGFLSKTQNSIKTIYPDFFELSNVGNLLLASPDKLNSRFIETVHNQGMKVVPFISNHWDRKLGEIALDNRENLSNQIVEAVNQYNFDGVNVDIENVTDLYRLQYTDFIRLLRQKLPSDKIVSVAVAANPYGWTTGWHGSYDYKALSEYADYLMIMAYDESYPSSPEGPVSSSNFFNKSIQYALNQGVSKEKIVVGMPFFGRYWKMGDALGGLGIAATDVDNLLKNYVSVSRFDDSAKSTYAEVTIKPGQPEPIIWGNRRLTAGTYHIWYDCPEATRYKLNVIDGYNVKGVGSWSLGQEIPTIWNFYTVALNNETIPPTPEPSPKPVPAPDPEPIPIPILPEPNPKPLPPVSSITNNQKIINALKEAEDPRNITDNTQLTRGETAVALAKLTNLNPDTSSDAIYTDIENYWGRGYINALYNHGMLKNFISNTFSPNTVVTKEDIAVLLEKVLDLPNLTNLPLLSFKDLERNRWSYSSIAKMYYLNLMEGFNKNFFRPTDAMTVNDIARILDVANSYGYGFRNL